MSRVPTIYVLDQEKCTPISEEYKSDFRKFAQKRPLHVIIFLTVSVLPNIFPTRLVKCL